MICNIWFTYFFEIILQTFFLNQQLHNRPNLLVMSITPIKNLLLRGKKGTVTPLIGFYSQTVVLQLPARVNMQRSVK